MERRLAYSFADVRIHDDTTAAASARAIAARAYTVGNHVAFATGEYQPRTAPGRRLLAHELAHVVQQRGSSDPGSDLRLGSPQDSAENEASSAEVSLEVGAGSRSRSRIVRRRIVADPPGAIDVVGLEVNETCPTGFAPESPQTGRIEGRCSTSSTRGCECFCDAANDPARTYTIQVRPANLSWASETLFDGTSALAPQSSLWPNTTGGQNPTIQIADPTSSTVEFGFFDSAGRANWYPHWRILAHELCGHGRLRQGYGGGTGNRPGHDVTIDTENGIAGEHGEPTRGHFSDLRQGEAFYNPVGNRTRVAFRQRNGFHFEPP